MTVVTFKDKHIELTRTHYSAKSKSYSKFTGGPMSGQCFPISILFIGCMVSESLTWDLDQSLLRVKQIMTIDHKLLHTLKHHLIIQPYLPFLNRHPKLHLHLRCPPKQHIPSPHRKWRTSPNPLHLGYSKAQSLRHRKQVSSSRSAGPHHLKCGIEEHC